MDITFILYSIGVFLAIVLVLVIILLVAKKYLSPSGNVTITINGKDKLLVDGREARNTMELITAIYKSACFGRSVHLPLPTNDVFYRKGGIAAVMPHFHEKTKSVENVTVSTPITLGRDVGG